MSADVGGLGRGGEMRFAVIVPIFNEEGSVADLAEQLNLLKDQGAAVVVVDGSSTDSCAPLLRQLGFTVVNAPKMRSRQMNVGAWWAKKIHDPDVLLFLHADTRMPSGSISMIERALTSEKASPTSAKPSHWGRFDVALSGQSLLFKVIGYLINLRSRLTGIATGDQAIFVRADTFYHMGGFRAIRLMEDVEISKRLRAKSLPVCLRARVITSSRRWEQGGVWRTIWLMWKLRFLYWVGVSPDKLSAQYH